MPNWEDENGRYWFVPKGSDLWCREQIPHSPTSEVKGCKCAFCLECRNEEKNERDKKKRKNRRKIK